MSGPVKIGSHGTELRMCEGDLGFCVGSEFSLRAARAVTTFHHLFLSDFQIEKSIRG